MIRLKLMDGDTLEIPREEALALLPFRGVFVSPMLRSPIEGLLIHRGKVVPVLGPFPPADEPVRPAEERAWILLLKDCAQVVRGFPTFDAPAASVDPATAGEPAADLLPAEPSLSAA